MIKTTTVWRFSFNVYRKYFERENPNVLVVDEEDTRPIEEQLIEKFGIGEKPVIQKKK